MQTEQGNMLISLHAVQAFLDRNADKLAGVVKTGTRQRLDDAIVALSGHTTAQTGSALAAQGATQVQRELRTTLLRDHMKPISRIARSDLPRTPQLEPLRMPRGRPTIMRLAAAAKGMAKEAASHTDVFVAAGQPVDFVAQLNEAADALVASVNDRVDNRALVKHATTGLKGKLTAGRRIVHVLDAFVNRALKKENPELLAEWNLVQRVQKTRVRRATTTVVPALTVSTGTPEIPAPATAAPVPVTAAA